jgi:NADH-quinone oxidoreductase subunit C
MTRAISGSEAAEKLMGIAQPLSVEANAITLRPEDVVTACTTLRDDADLDLKYLNSLTAVDLMDCVEVVYHVQSIARNQMLRIKARAEDYVQPEVPSVSSVWWGAHLMERETYDLMGVRFVEHPDLRRILLWEGFPGHPLRKDYLRVPGADPGWPYFPGEPDKQADPAWRQQWTPDLGGAPAARGEDPEAVPKHDELLHDIKADRD